MSSSLRQSAAGFTISFYSKPFQLGYMCLNRTRLRGSLIRAHPADCDFGGEISFAFDRPPAIRRSIAICPTWVRAVGNWALEELLRREHATVRRRPGSHRIFSARQKSGRFLRPRARARISTSVFPGRWRGPNRADRRGGPGSVRLNARIRSHENPANPAGALRRALPPR